MQKTPLARLLLGPLLGQLLEPEAVLWITGGGGTIASDLSNVLLTWLLFFSALNGFYAMVAPWVCRSVESKYPDAPTNRVGKPLTQNMASVARAAFPLYSTVPMLHDLFRYKNWSRCCDTAEECGGWAAALLGCAAYFVALEAVIFFDHYYLLHKLSLGKRLMEHAKHHVYKYADQLNAFSGYSFAPQDGWSQGLPLAVCTLFIPVPLAFVYLMEALTAMWTLYIHTDVRRDRGWHLSRRG
jgi:lathosterol oxidase